MWANQRAPLRMGPGPLSLLFLATWQVAVTQPVLIIESVRLTVLPGQHVARGTDVTLRCDPKITSGAGRALSHQYAFYRDGAEVHTNTGTTASSLPFLIRSARVANSGSYKCSVTVLGKHMESNSESLNVTGMQTPLLFLNKSEVNEGEELTASCTAPEETGSFYFYFFEGSREVARVSASAGLADALLKFTAPGNKSLTCHYVIVLQPGLAESGRSEPALVHVHELSIRPYMEITPSTGVIEGDDLQIACNVNGSRRRPSGITVYVSKDSVLKKSGNDSIVYRKRVQSHDTGLYECKVAMGNVLKSVSSSVLVSDLFSKPVLTMEPRDVFEKEYFSLSCYSHNISTLRIQRGDVRYSLYRNGRDLTPGNYGGKFRTRADASLNGNYSCHAVVGHMRKSSEVTSVRVKALVSKPSISAFGKVIVGKPFWIHCHCENGTLPISYTLLSHRVPQQSIFRARQANDSAFFSVVVRRKEDVRNFTCEAENNGFSSKRESDPLDVAVIEPVSAPTLLIMPEFGSVTEGEELYLACSVKEGTPPFTFRWYRDGREVPLSTKVTKERSGLYELGAARREHAGAYRCAADNPAKEASRSGPARVSVRLARWKTVLIGASCVLLLVLLIGAGCYRYRAKRGKRETVTELSVKPSSPKSEDSLTVSLAHGPEVYNAPKDHADAGGRSVWSERESESGEGCRGPGGEGVTNHHHNTDDQSSEEAPKQPDVEYTEVVHPRPADGSQGPMRKGTDTVYSELQNSPQGVADQSGYQGSMEYVQLSHDLPEPV